MTDRYEQQFMGGDEAVFREKHISRLFVALMAIPALFVFVMGIVAGIGAGPLAALIPIAVSLVVALVTLYFAAMRITVTPTHIEVRYGNLGPSIPIADLTSVEIEKLDTLTRLAFGPKWQGPGSWSYVPPGVRDGVRVKWKVGDKQRSALIGARDAAALASAIRRSQTGKAPRARVEDAVDEVHVEAKATQEKKAKA
jgi:hypothetical protein